MNSSLQSAIHYHTYKQLKDIEPLDIEDIGDNDMTQTRLQHPETGKGNMPLHFDEDGFLINSAGWSRETARILAEVDGIGHLGADHWAIIFYLREHHLENGSLPVMSHVCRVMHLGKYAVDRLFGGCRTAWRIAGLPNPGEEALSYMS